jgi:hypothetical protein
MNRTNITHKSELTQVMLIIFKVSAGLMPYYTYSVDFGGPSIFGSKMHASPHRW